MIKQKGSAKFNMYMYDIIEKKRLGKTLSKQEIEFVVQGFVANEISKQQMSSLMMAIVLNGMTDQETIDLTLAMKNSSETLQFDEIIVDKHSTGGVSDSTTLLVVPILASLGVKIGKMSGRALGFTGGTIDKLEVFKGYQVQKTLQEFKQLVQQVGCAIISQTKDLAYADKLMYALRNETATVDSIPLIASSIMSKKLAGGSKFLLLNVQYGSGAFMKTKQDAKKLAELMVKIGRGAGVQTHAVVSNMDTPLSAGVGCSLEVEQAMQSLQGKPSKLLELSKVIAVTILQNVKAISKKQATQLVEQAITNKTAMQKLKQLVQAQGGDANMVDNWDLLPVAKYKVPVYAAEFGFVNKLDALTVARVAKHLKDDNKVQSTKQVVGVKLLVGIGDKVKQGQQIAELHVNKKGDFAESVALLQQAFVFARRKKTQPKLIEQII